MEYIAERITIDPDLCNGKPTIRGKRITVQTILEFLSAGDSPEEILKQYPSLEPEDIEASLKFASKLLGNGYEVKPIAQCGFWKMQIFLIYSAFGMILNLGMSKILTMS